MKTVVPYKEKNTTKKEQVAEMFDNISARYDLLNHLLSVGIDVYWRNKALQILKKYQPDTLLDIATGTADFAIQAIKIKPKSIIGIDISEGMLEVGRQKIVRKKLTEHIVLQTGDAESLQFNDASFSAAMVAFGVRNFQDLHKGLSEIKRVLQTNAPLIILEFSKPKTFPVKQVFQFYFKFVLPLVGKFVSKDKSAYTYLPESVDAFPEGAAMVQILEQIGFKKAHYYPLTFGICTIYVAEK